MTNKLKIYGSENAKPHSKDMVKIRPYINTRGIKFKWELKRASHIIPEPTARSAVPGVSPGRGLLIPHGYLHPGKCEHSEVQSSSMIAGASLWLIGGPR